MPEPDHGLLKHLRHVTLADYKITSRLGDPEALERVRRWVEDLEENLTNATGLLLVGDPGGGKTMLAHAMVNATLAAGHSAFFIPLEAYNKTLQRMFKLEKLWERYDDPDALDEWRQKDRKIIDIRNRIELVVLDDVGKEHSTDSRFVEDEFDFLVRHRHARGLTTAMTSNIQPRDWAKTYSPAMRSFVREICRTVPVDAHDYRAR